jgi:hypothetical protein
MTNHPEMIKPRTQTVELMSELMKQDNISVATQVLVMSTFETMLNTDSYVSHIKSNLAEIIADNKFSMSDLPYILEIIITTNKLAMSSLKLKHDITPDNMKYLVYGMLIQFVVFENTALTGLFITALKDTYPGLWQLVLISLVGASIVKTRVKILCSKCC